MARCGCAIAIACISARHAAAGTVTFDNGVTGPGYTSVTPDDYGTYGFLIGQQFDDEFYPPGVSNPFTPTHLSGPMLFITTAGMHTSSVLLTDYKPWADYVENPPPQPDGILADAMHTGLTRSVATAIAMSGTNKATSAFRIASTQAGILIDVGLVQSLTSDSVTVSSHLDSVYTFTNNGTVPVSLVLHILWDSDLFYNGANKDNDDIVGAGPGVCGVYQHDGDPRWSVALGNGPLSTVPLTYYYGGKEGFVPGSPPAFVPDNVAIDMQYIWLGHGMPASWRNYVVGPGKNAVGESSPSLVGDATIGIEYQFPVAVGASETINVRRYWGTTTVPCFVSANCGNGVVDSGELCDGADTPTCNGATCTASVCGDGYMNVAAGEQCDSSGVDSETCVGATCLVSACGDGYVNAAAGEDCEAGELCDTSTCQYNFSVGGGCAGCGVSGMPDASWLLCVAGGLLVLRRRRRVTRR
jgi:hypothetical protein